jgi:dipeptidyl aminopeptidase/acylaminoacyl peptidase
VDQPILPERRILTPELVVSQRMAIDPRISPDGSWILYVVERPSDPNTAVQGRVFEVWRVGADGGESQRVAPDLWGATSPRWSSDGTRFGFLGQETHEAPAQIHVVEVAGTATTATTSTTAVTNFAWSPDGRQIAYLAADPALGGYAVGPDPIIVGTVSARVRLHVLDLVDGRDRVVSPADRSIVDMAWAPDGSRLVAVVATDPFLDHALNRAWIAVIGVDGSIVDRTAPCGITRDPRWSPDGSWLAWLGSVSPNDSPGTSVFVAPADGGEARNITATYGGSVMAMDWIPCEDATLALQAAEGSSWFLRKLHVPDGEVEALVGEPRAVVGPPSVSADGRVIAVTANRREHPDEVHVAVRDADGAYSLSRVTHLNPQLEGLALGEQSIVTWRAQDGLELDGVLITPLDYDPNRTYPVLMYVHSGPEWVMSDGWLGDFWHGWGQLLAGDGVVTLCPNYRGGVGHGPAFGLLSCGDLGGGEFDDVVAGLEHLVATGIADPDRAAIGGGSWGGYLAAWGATAGSRHFRAAIVYAAITDWLSMSGTSDSLLHEQVCHIGCTVEEDPQRFLAISPVAHAAGSRTATLILHGQEDPSDPVGQAYELDSVLRRVGGAPLETVIYPREEHQLAEPAHQADLLTRMRAWVLRHAVSVD